LFLATLDIGFPVVTIVMLRHIRLLRVRCLYLFRSLSEPINMSCLYTPLPFHRHIQRQRLTCIDRLEVHRRCDTKRGARPDELLQLVSILKLALGKVIKLAFSVN
jgi:hypothetical protein